jgi:hypothetical protein
MGMEEYVKHRFLCWIMSFQEERENIKQVSNLRSNSSVASFAHLARNYY